MVHPNQLQITIPKPVKARTAVLKLYSVSNNQNGERKLSILFKIIFMSRVSSYFLFLKKESNKEIQVRMILRHIRPHALINIGTTASSAVVHTRSINIHMLKNQQHISPIKAQGQMC